MRSIKSGLFGFALASLLGAFSVVGCAADGGSDDFIDFVEESDPTEPTTQLPSAQPRAADDNESSKSGSDAGAKKGTGSNDGGKSEAPKDAGPPAPEEGDPCPTDDEVFIRSCGFCGKQEAICFEGKVGKYGACKGQVEDGCEPGTSETVSCGNCGTQTRTCTQFCKWSLTPCTGEPKNSCTPGTTDLVDTACPADQYQQRTCKDTCTWGFSNMCSAPPTVVDVPATVGGVSTTIGVLSSAQVAPRLNVGNFACPQSTSWPPTSPTVTPYTYIQVRNPLPKAVKVSIYNSQVSGAPVIDTVMTHYVGTTIPATVEARRACKGAVNDYGNSTLTGSSSFASLDGSYAVTIPAGGSVQVYFAAYSATGNNTGPVKLNVRTDAIMP